MIEGTNLNLVGDGISYAFRLLIAGYLSHLQVHSTQAYRTQFSEYSLQDVNLQNTYSSFGLRTGYVLQKPHRRFEMIVCIFPLGLVYVLFPLNVMLNIDTRVLFPVLNSLGKFFCKNGCFLGGDKVVEAAANSLD